jgi:outer membrane protein assembly factor BamB
MLASLAAAQQVGAPWPMERQDRWGTGQAVVGPGSYSTPWISTQLASGYPVSHGPCLALNNIGFFGDWAEDNLYMFDTTTGNVLGTFYALNFVVSTPAIMDWNNVFFATDAPSTGAVFSIDSTIMDFNWFCTVGATGLSPTIGPDGDIVLTSGNGVSYRWDPAGDIIWQTSGLGAARGPTVFTRDDLKVVTANGNHLTALNYADGSIAWDDNFNSPVGAPGVAPSGPIVCGCDDGTIRAIDPATGNVLWHQTALAEVRGGPGFNGGTVYVPSYDHRLYAFRMTDGHRLWSYTSSYWIEHAPTIGADGRIYFHTKYGDFYCLSPTGSLIWTIPLVGESRGPCTIGPDGTLYVGRTADDSQYSGLAIIRQQPAHVTGKIVYGDLAASAARPQATLELRVQGETTDMCSVAVTPDASGNFVADFPITFRQNGNGAAGQYTISVKVSHWLRRDVNVDLRGGQAGGVVINLINGDVNGDNAINLADLVAIASAGAPRRARRTGTRTPT